MSAIVRANTRYFAKQGWEQPEIMDEIDRWLNDREDSALSQKIGSWFLCDALWTKEILPAMVRHLWYVAPAVLLVTMSMRGLLLGWAKEVVNGKHSGSS